MINATLQSVAVGNLVNLKTAFEVKNGHVLSVGAKDSAEVYAGVLPATATLGTEPLVLIFNDETTKNDYDNITTGSTHVAGTILRGYYLTAGDKVDFDALLLDGSPAVGKYLIPQNGSGKLVVADDLTDETKLAFQIKAATKIGFAKRNAWEAVVISA